MSTTRLTPGCLKRNRVKPLALVLAAFLVAGALASSAGEADAGGGARLAPEIALQDGINGITSATTLASLRGKPVVLVFWIPICPHCASAAADLQRLQRTYGARGLKVLAVCHGKKRYVAQWLQQRGYNFGVGFDWSRVSGDRYGVRMLPGAFFIGKDGSIRQSGLAGIDAAIQSELNRP